LKNLERNTKKLTLRSQNTKPISNIMAFHIEIIKFFRRKNLSMTPIQKFQAGIRRIIRIVKSYKANTLTDLLKQAQEMVKEERK
jgi:hypothetical protein